MAEQTATERAKEELRRKREKAARDRRLAKAFGQRGKERRRDQFLARAEPAQREVAQRERELNPAPAFLSSDQIKALGGQTDRARVAAQLRAQAAAAREAQRRERSQERLSRDDERDIDRLEKVARRSTALASQVEQGTGALPESIELQVGRARFPDKKTTELRSRFGTREQRDRATAALRRRRQAERAKEDAGFEGTTGEFIRQQKREAEAAQRQAAVEQRERFVASGESKQASAEEVRRAQQSQIRKGNIQVIDPVTGKPLRVQPGGVVVGVRQAEQQPRPPVRQERPAPQRTLVLPSRDRPDFLTATNIAVVQAGPPEPVGGIDFGRRETPTFTQRALQLAGREPELGTEVSRRSRIFRQRVTAPDERTAELAGLPGPGTFDVVTEDRQDVPRQTSFEVSFPKTAEVVRRGREEIERFDQASVDLAKTAEKPRDELSTREVILRPAANVLRGVQEIGKNVRRTGDVIATTGEKLGETRFFQATSQIPIVRRLPPAQLPAGLAVTGGIIESTGRAVEERPLTGGATEAFLIGGVFGLVSKGAKAVRASRFATRATTGSKILRGTAATVGGAEKVAGVALGAAFVAQTGREVSQAETQREAGQVVGRAGVQLIGFGAGLKASGVVVRGASKATSNVVDRVQVAKANRRLRGKIVTRDTLRDLQRTSKEVGVEVRVRPIERDVFEFREVKRGGTAEQQLRGERVLGPEELVRPEDLVAPGDPFLARADVNIARLRTEGTTKGSTQPARRILRTEQKQAEGVVTAAEILKNEPRGRDVAILRTEQSGLKAGQQELTAGTLTVEFNPISLSAETGLQARKGTQSAQTAKRLTREPKRLERGPEQAQLERVVRFKDEPGPTNRLETPDVFGAQRGRAELLVRKDTGEFALREFTEFRRFQRGTRGIPGRPSITRGRLTPEGLEALKRKPQVITKVESRKPKKDTSPVEQSSPTVSDTTEVESGAQVLLKKRAAKTTQRQETVTLTEQRQEAKAVAASKQESKQQAKAETIAESLQRGKTLASRIKQAAKSALGLKTGQRARTGLRAAPLLEFGQAQRQESRQVSKVDAAQDSLQDQAALQAQVPALDQAARTRTRQQSRLQQAQRPKSRLQQAISQRLREPPKTPGALPRLPDRTGGSPAVRLLIKRGGKFVRVPGLFTREQAEVKGAKLVGAGAAQTAKLVETDETVRDEGVTRSFATGVLESFKVKRKGNLLREERGKALIDTPGEVQAIQRRGVRASVQARRIRGLR